MLEKSIAYEEAGIMVCDECGEALEDCYKCGEDFIEDQDIYCEVAEGKDCNHYCNKCGDEIKLRSVLNIKYL